MLNRLPRTLGVAILLVATWIAFECFVSWAAFCNNPEKYGGVFQTTEEYDCISRGPIITLTTAFVSWWRHVFHQPDAYIALFTAVLAISTIALWVSTRNLWKAGRDQLELARSEFISTHRPRMRFKHAWFTGDPLAWRVGRPLEVNLEFVNVGRSDALVYMVNYQSIILQKGDRLPQRPPYDEIPDSGARITRFPTIARVPSGVTLHRELCDGIVSQQQVVDIIHGRQTLYLIGTIEYSDSLMRVRQTAFCRRLTYKTYPPTEITDFGRFEVEKDPDYEYED
jgi:hypothetical protein